MNMCFGGCGTNPGAPIHADFFFFFIKEEGELFFFKPLIFLLSTEETF